MKTINHSSRIGRRAFLAVGSSLAALTLASAYAQDEPETIAEARGDQLESADTIVVTGSRIRREADEVVDVNIIGEVEIENRAFTNVLEGVEQLPLAGAGVNNFTSDNTGQNGGNNAFPDLLNLGTNRTLTLVNGRRFVSSNQATVFVPDNANGAQVDLTLLNPAMVERTEVLVGTGGPIYGADAVGGVVNVILKDDYEGAEITGQYGVTDRGDGETYRVNGIWGKNFLDNRANITVSAEYLDSGSIDYDPDGDRQIDRNIDDFQNPYFTSDTDGQPNNVYFPGVTNPFLAPGGLLVGSSGNSGGAQAPYFPFNQVPNFSSDTFNPNNLSPFEFYQTPQGQAINSLLYVGSFNNNGNILTIDNPDPATAPFLPRLAVPLGFNPDGTLRAYNIGNITPPEPAQVIDTIGSEGIPQDLGNQLRSAQERISFNAFGRYEITDRIRVKQELLFADITNEFTGAPTSNTPFGGTTAGGRAVPLYLDENPFIAPSALAQIDALEAQGLNIDTIDDDGDPLTADKRVLYLSRSLADIQGLTRGGDEQQAFRSATVVEGDFDFIDRAFYWDASVVYGRSEAENFDDDVLDVEFALATDVVRDPATGEVVCRQQLTGPEPIANRNPSLSNLNSRLPSPITPTQAQVDSCVPLNLLGFGSPNQAAIDYVTTPLVSENISEQLYFAGSFGGDIIDLPAGTAAFNAQIEHRIETNEFKPGRVFGQGLARSTSGNGSEGTLKFIEWGSEFIVPVFGNGFSFPLLNELEINGAVRWVRRNIESDSNPAAEFAEPTTDNTYSFGGRYSPIDDLTFRGTKSKSVRSPSVVELVGAGVTGFAALPHPCDSRFIGSVNSNVDRARTNCQTLLNAQGISTPLADFTAPFVSLPAAGASNIDLANEVANNWTFGVVYEPRWVDNLTLQADWYAIDLEDQIGLDFIGFSCFDSADFPNVIVGGANACEALAFAVDDGTGNFVVPETFELTGRPLSPIAQPGSDAISQQAGAPAFGFFSTINSAVSELRALNSSINYRFDLEDVFGAKASNWGQISTNGTVYYVHRYDVANDGETFRPDAGEPGFARYETRFDLSHALGPLTHTFQWFRTSGTVDNVELDRAEINDQAGDFVLPSLNTYNYNLAYEFNDRLTGRFVVNNLTDKELAPRRGFGGIGRNFQIAVNYEF